MKRLFALCATTGLFIGTAMADDKTTVLGLPLGGGKMPVKIPLCPESLENNKTICWLSKPTIAKDGSKVGYIDLPNLLPKWTGMIEVTILYGHPQKSSLIDFLVFLGEAPAVVYPASSVGSVRPVPTWNLPALRQSIQAAAGEPAELSASNRVGVTRFAMMGDQSRRKGWAGNPPQAATA